MIKNPDECFIKTGTLVGCVGKCDEEELLKLQTESARQSMKNWINGGLKNPKYINGPFSFTKHTKNENGITRYVYVFGEHHTKSANCEEWKDITTDYHGNSSFGPKDEEIMDISDFLVNLIENTPVFLDVFLEMSRNVMKGGMDCYLRDAEYVLKDYISVNGIRKPLKQRSNVRVHSIDVRLDDDTQIGLCKYSMSTKQHDIPEILKKIKKIYDLSRKIYNNYDDDNIVWSTIVEFINKFMIVGNVKKEFDKTTREYKDFIYKILTNEGYFRNEILNVLERIRIGYSELNTSIENIIHFIYSEMMPIDVLSMDIYTISRMFKGFRTENKPDNPFLPYNSIIYAGNYHANNYRRIFELMGFDSTDLHTFGNGMPSYEYLINTQISHKFIVSEKEQVVHTPQNCAIVNVDEAYPLFGVQPCNENLHDFDELFDQIGQMILESNPIDS